MSDWRTDFENAPDSGLLPGVECGDDRPPVRARLAGGGRGHDGSSG